MALTPAVAASLIAAGMHVTVERSPTACIDGAEFEKTGCRLVDAGCWPEAPEDAIILGLKELVPADFPLLHRHIHFAHIYKYQQGWQQMLGRYAAGGGTLYDLEYLVDEQHRRIATFGYWAGYAGAALGLLAWCGQQEGASPSLAPQLKTCDQFSLQGVIKERLLRHNKRPEVMVMGARGRSGRGAIELVRDLEVNVIAWDIEQTAGGGPFEQILAADIFINCVFIAQPIPPFLTADMLLTPGRTLSVICDVSCDPYGSYNPLPIYDQVTSFADPVNRLVAGDNPLDLISIDHLPSLLPHESTQDFVAQLQPALLALDDPSVGVWSRAEEIFRLRMREAAVT